MTEGEQEQERRNPLMVGVAYGIIATLGLLALGFCAGWVLRVWPA